MHSSKMRTARLLTVSRSIPCISGRGFAQSLCGCKPPPCGQTNTCENITLPQTSLAGGNMGDFENTDSTKWVQYGIAASFDSNTKRVKSVQAVFWNKVNVERGFRM